ncbi:MAG: beta strand repeat-containing protein [Solirubrobacterales bacterium]
MKRLASPALAIVVASVTVVLGGSALAYFSSQGLGTAQAAVGKLTAPTISAATPAAGGTVTLTWGAVTPPGPESVRYYVTRDGSAAAGTCPTAAAPTTVITCKDAGVPIGEHIYVVTAVWETWSAVSGAKTANVTVGEATKFTISGSASSMPAGGTGINLTITAKDVNNSTVTTYTGSHSLVFSGASASPTGTNPTVVNSAGSAINFGSATALTFTSGVASVTSSKNGLLKLYRVGSASVVATEGTLTTPTPLALTVTQAAASKFVLAAANATPSVGAGDDLTITAQDAYGNLATAYTGTQSLTFSGPVASPTGNGPTVADTNGSDVPVGTATPIDFSAGVASAATGDGGTMKLYKSGSTTISATATGMTTLTAATVTVAAGSATKFALTASTTTPVAAATFNFTTTALDTYGNTATSYAGAKNITFAGAEASPSGALPTVVNSAGTAINFGSATSLTFTAGVAAVASAKNGVGKLNKAGAASVTAADGTISTAAPLAFTVATGAASKAALTTVSVSAGTIGSPCLFTCTITGLGNSGTVNANVTITDGVGNPALNLGSAKTVTVTVSSGGTITGSPLTVPASGVATTNTQFVYTAPATGAFTHTITAASTGYTSATATVSR